MLWHRPPIYRLIYEEEPSSRAITLKEIIDSWIAPFLSASISPRASISIPNQRGPLPALTSRPPPVVLDGDDGIGVVHLAIFTR